MSLFPLFCLSAVRPSYVCRINCKSDLTFSSLDPSSSAPPEFRVRSNFRPTCVEAAFQSPRSDLQYRPQVPVCLTDLPSCLNPDRPPSSHHKCLLSPHIYSHPIGVVPSGTSTSTPPQPHCPLPVRDLPLPSPTVPPPTPPPPSKYVLVPVWILYPHLRRECLVPGSPLSRPLAEWLRVHGTDGVIRLVRTSGVSPGGVGPSVRVCGPPTVTGTETVGGPVSLFALLRNFGSSNINRSDFSTSS